MTDYTREARTLVGRVTRHQSATGHGVTVARVDGGYGVTCRGATVFASDATEAEVVTARAMRSVSTYEQVCEDVETERRALRSNL